MHIILYLIIFEHLLLLALKINALVQRIFCLLDDWVAAGRWLGLLHADKG